MQKGAVEPGSFRSMQWAFPIAVALHNVEEAIFMPRWLADHRNQMSLRPASSVIWAALLITALAAFVVTRMSMLGGKHSFWAYLFFGGAATMLVNVFVPRLSEFRSSGDTRLGWSPPFSSICQ